MNGSRDVLPRVDEAARAAAEDRQAALTKPPGSLGELERIAVCLAGFQATSAPEARPCSVMLFAGDHPVTKKGISPYPSAVTRAMVENFVAGGAAASVLSSLHRLPLHVVDVGVDGEDGFSIPEGGPHFHRMLPRVVAGDISEEAALSTAGFEQCVAYGAGLVREHCRDDRLLIFGEMGIGNTTAAAALGAALLDLVDPTVIVGRGTGAAGAMLERKKEIVARAVRRVSRGADPEELLRQLGGREMVAMYGAMKEALSLRKMVLVDGFIVTAVALALARKVPEAREGMIFSHQSDEQGHSMLLEALRARPLLRLGLRLGEASGALTAFPIVEAACATHNRMATFESAAVPRKDG